MKYVLFSLAGIMMLAAPSYAHGYTTTDQRAQKINETTAIFFIDFAFGHEDKDFYIPILATRNQNHGSEVTSIGYEILEESKETTKNGTALAIVLSKGLAIEHGMYKIPKGFKAPLSLAVIYTTDKALREADYAVSVTDLPFYSGEERTYLHLNPSELQYYITPEVELNSDNPETVRIKVNVQNIEYTVRD